MTAPTSRFTRSAVLAGIGLLALVLPAVVVTDPGAAAHLDVDGGVAQFWDLRIEPTDPRSDLTACGDVADDDDCLLGGAGDDQRVGAVSSTLAMQLGADAVTLRAGVAL